MMTLKFGCFVTGTAPEICKTLLAAALLGEPVTSPIHAALVCVIAGFLVSKRKPKARATSANTATRSAR